MLNRRNFIKLSSLTAAGGFLFGASGNVFGQVSERFPIPTEAYADKSNQFNKQIFEPLIDSNFTVARDDAPPISMRLVEVVGRDAKTNRFNKVSTDGFLLIFEVGAAESLEDQIYQVAHPALGEFSMSVSTVGRSGRRYQAVYNRIYS